MTKRYNRLAYILISILIISIIFTGCSSDTNNTKETNISTSDESKNEFNIDKLEVHFIDVGQADCILIKTPDNKVMVIDAGNNADSDLVVNYLKNQGVRSINYVIGTHPHEDHIGGLDAVIDSFAIKNVYMPKVLHNTKTFDDVIKAVKNKGLKIKTAKAGVELNLGENIETLMMSPNKKEYEELNNYSPIIYLKYSQSKFIFTGDAEKEVEHEVLSKGYNIKADVLKVGHHGSSSSTTDEFLNSISPEYAIICVGEENKYGHPHKETIEKLSKEGISIFRTDKVGTIVAVSDGNSISFNKKPLKKVVDNSQKPEQIDIEISSVDFKKEIVHITNNTSEDINMTGWKLVSVKGSQEFYFPNGFILKSNTSITIASGKAKGDLKWSDKTEYIWNNDGDMAELYDNKGKLIHNK